MLSINSSPIRSSVEYFAVTAAEFGQRLDNFLIKTLKDVPRSHVYRIIRKGEVRINNKRAKPHYKLTTGDQIRIPPIRMNPKPNTPDRIPETLLKQLEALILFENQHFIVINKPSGLAVHSGSGIDYDVISSMRRLRPNCDLDLVHRLDRGTSGCLLVAKHRQSLLALQGCIQDQSIRKIYLALVQGIWPDAVTEINHPLRKTTLSNGEKHFVPAPQGQQARTRILQSRIGHHASLLTMQLYTGRTHQIRVHCQAEGHAIIGDDKYGDRDFNRAMRKLGMKRLMLHASRLSLRETIFNREITIHADTPEAFLNAW